MKQLLKLPELFYHVHLEWDEDLTKLEFEGFHTDDMTLMGDGNYIYANSTKFKGTMNWQGIINDLQFGTYAGDAEYIFNFMLAMNEVYKFADKIGFKYIRFAKNITIAS